MTLFRYVQRKLTEARGLRKNMASRDTQPALVFPGQRKQNSIEFQNKSLKMTQNIYLKVIPLILLLLMFVLKLVNCAGLLKIT